MGNNFEQSDGSSLNRNDSSNPSQSASEQAMALLRERRNNQSDSRMPAGFPDSNSVIAYDNTPNYLQGRVQDGQYYPGQQAPKPYYPAYPTLASVLHKSDNHYQAQVQGYGDHHLTANVQQNHHQFNPRLQAQLNHHQYQAGDHRNDHRLQSGVQHQARMDMDVGHLSVRTPQGNLQRIDFWTPHNTQPGLHWEGNIPNVGGHVPYYKHMDGHVVQNQYGQKYFQIDKISHTDKAHAETLRQPWYIPLNIDNRFRPRT